MTFALLGQTALLIGAPVAFLAYWLIWSKKADVSLTGAVVKFISTGAFAMLVFADSGPAWLAMGLACGALGDFCLARRGEKAFLSGMAAFALGHLIYAWGLFARGAEIAPLQFSTPQIIAVLCLGAIVLSTEVWLAPRTGALRWPVRSYVLVIGFMGLAAIVLPAHPDNPSAAIILLGAGLFILSDFLLALRLFIAQAEAAQRALSLALWPAYWCGQLFIMVGSILYAFPFGA